MKKIILCLALLLSTVVGASAMSYSQARDQALFLSDKMAYELNLTDEQYRAAYEINLDYLMNINTSDDLFGAYWEQRNLDLSYILFSWQYSAFVAASYFYRPLYWEGGFWHFAIYARYPHRDYFFFGRPAFYATYHGGHSWHHNGGRSYWAAHRVAPPHGKERPHGMRDRFDKGHFGNGTRLSAQGGSRSFPGRLHDAADGPRADRPARTGSFGSKGPRPSDDRQYGNTTTDGTPRHFPGSTRPSSTRTTVKRPSTTSTHSFGNRSAVPGRTFTPSSRRPSQPSDVPARSFSRPSGSPGIGNTDNTMKSRSFSSGSNSRAKSSGSKPSGPSSARGRFGGRR